MGFKADYYNFHENYEQDWKAFIAQFPEDIKLNNEPIVFDIKECCCEIDQLIRTLYKDDPSYTTQMPLYFTWGRLRTILVAENSHAEKALEWFARQLMNMIICDNLEIVKSIWYAIAVNYFECGRDGAFLLEKMYDGLPEGEIPQLIKYSISIPWMDKVQTYQKMTLNKEYHELLADAIYNSCNAYCYGSAKSSEAIELLNQLDINQYLYQQVFDILTTPIQTKIQKIVVLEKASSDGITGFLSIISDSSFPTWFPYAELWIANEYIGTFTENCSQLEWKSIESSYNITIEHELIHQEKILAIKTPFNKDWLNQLGELRPI